ncbi:MAG: hypothetical protein HY313_00135 [Acidobacteria bacterium]|nr:hypothetical protein [Acidobacteriota bacterium]
MEFNWAHVHLWLNHFPVFGILFGLVLLIVALRSKNDPLKRLSLILFVCIGLITIGTYLTGEPAEEVAEHIPGVSESAIEPHEESALWSLIAIEALAVVSLAGLLFSRRSVIPSTFITICLLFSIIAMALVTWTAYLGGQIHHPETRPGFQAPVAGNRSE